MAQVNLDSRNTRIVEMVLPDVAAEEEEEEEEGALVRSVSRVPQKVKEVKQTRTRRWQVSHLLRAQDLGRKLESKFRGTWLSGLWLTQAASGGDGDETIRVLGRAAAVVAGLSGEAEKRQLKHRGMVLRELLTT